MGLVYVAAAWGFLQGLEYLSGTYDWPRQIQQYTTLVLLIGLPVVLVLAYYHGDRGQQRVTTPELAMVTLLLLLGGGAFWYYQRASERSSDSTPTATVAPSAVWPAVGDARPSIAVLPFENRSRDADDAFFVDGIHDDILTQLSKVGAIRVISRNYRSQLERSEEMLGRAIALNPNYASAHLWLAATLHGLGRREEALAAAERAVVLDPLSAIINVTLGDVRAGVGRFDDALVAYAQAIEVEPTIAVAYAYIGDVHAFGFGRLDAAMAWYEKATTLDPGAPGILASPARAHRRCTIDPKFKSPMVGRFPHPRGTDSPPVMAKK